MKKITKKLYLNSSNNGLPAYGGAKGNQGYALLFTLVIISVIMTIATGVANSFYKQLILSSTALESQIAFYQADTAGECGIYIEQNTPLPPIGSVSCGYDQNDTPIVLTTTSTVTPFTFSPDITLAGPCFNIIIDSSSTLTTIKAYGYNSCLASPSRKVERGVEITY